VNTVAVIFYAGNRVVDIEPTAISGDILMSELEIQLRKVGKSERILIDEFILRDLNTLAIGPAEDISAEVAVSYRNRIGLPAVVAVLCG
jgi:hypothetical protein